MVFSSVQEGFSIQSDKILADISHEPWKRNWEIRRPGIVCHMIKPIDPGALVDCVFQGKLESVCFKSGFAESNQVLAFGEPRKNKMTGVDFSKAVLCNASFSHDCDLSSVAMSADSSHLLYDNWKERLEKAAKLIKAWSEEDKSKGLSFIKTHAVQDDRQYWCVLNKNQVIKKLGPIGEKILSALE